MKQTEYNNYKQKVITLLSEKFLSNDKFVELHTDYVYKNTYSPSIQLDFVVTDHYKKLMYVYYICSQATYKGLYYTLREKLNYYNRYTEVGSKNIFLAFKDKSGELQTVSLETMNDPKVEKVEFGPRTATIDSFTKFYSIIKKWTGEYDSYESRLFFRGHSKTSYVSLPSIYRKESLISNENRIFHEAIRRIPNEFPDEMSTFDKLVKMQHYELPTRLLDTTTNPLVALYFACKDNLRSNGHVLIYPILQKDIQYYDSDLVSILANLVKRSILFSTDVTSDEWMEFIRDVEKETPKVNKKVFGDIFPTTLCVLPKLNNNRISNQDGAFFIFGINHTKKCPASLLDQPNIITIKAGAKQMILEELDFLGINEAFLFPETDKIMKQIMEEFCVNEKPENRKQEKAPNDTFQNSIDILGDTNYLVALQNYRTEHEDFCNSKNLSQEQKKLSKRPQNLSQRKKSKTNSHAPRKNKA